MKIALRIVMGLLLILGTGRVASPAPLLTAPGAFSLVSPNDGATGISLVPTLIWGASSGAASYTLEASADASFTTIVFIQAGILTTTYSPGAPVGQGLTVFWRVTAVNLSGNTVAGNAPFSFTTLTLPPGPFSLTAPSNGATGVALQPTFTWAPASGAATYTLEVSTDPGFSSLALSQSGLATTSFMPLAPLTGGTNYSWRVTAVNASGNTLATGAPFSFQTMTTGPGTFGLQSPPNLATSVGRNPFFFWDDAAGVDTYTLELATDAGFSSLVFRVTGIPGSSFGSSLTLTSGTTYYWRVTAVNGSGSTMATSAPFRFQTSNFSGGGNNNGNGFVDDGNHCGLLGLEGLLAAALALLVRRSRRT